MTATRRTLHHLVDVLPESEIERATLVVRALVDAALPYRPLDQAPPDDEPETEEERAAVAEALAEADRGELIPQEELERQLGLR
jgi:predicted transcriptional regulator